jgi:hypothetical protein
MQTILDDATESAKTKNPEIFRSEEVAKQKVYSSLQPVQFGGETLSPNRLRNIFEGNDPRYTISVETNSSGLFGGTGGMGTGNMVTYGVIKDKVTGRTVQNNAVREYLGIVDNKNTNFKSAIDKELGDHTVLQRMGISAGNIFTKANPWATNYLQTVFGQSLGIIDTEPGAGKVVFQNVGPIDPLTGKVRLQATRVEKGKPVQLSAKQMREAMAAQGGGAAPGNSMYGAQDINDNTLEITVPALSGAVSAPSYKETLTQLLNYQEQKLSTHPSQGLQMKLGYDADGHEYSIKTMKSIDGGMDYILMVNGQVGLRNKNKDMIINMASQALDNVKLK